MESVAPRNTESRLTDITNPRLGDLCIRDSLIGGRIHYAYILSDIVKVFYIITKLATINKILTLAGNINLIYKNILR